MRCVVILFLNLSLFFNTGAPAVFPPDSVVPLCCGSKVLFCEFSLGEFSLGESEELPQEAHFRNKVLPLLSFSLRVALAPRQIMSGLGTRRLPGAAHLCDTKKLNAEKDGW